LLPSLLRPIVDAAWKQGDRVFGIVGARSGDLQASIMTEDDPDIVARIEAFQLFECGHRSYSILVERCILKRRMTERIRVFRCTILFHGVWKSMHDRIGERYAGRRAEKPRMMLRIPCEENERRGVGRNADEGREVPGDVLDEESKRLAQSYRLSIAY
jgi:hypothetical protein